MDLVEEIASDSIGDIAVAAVDTLGRILAREESPTNPQSGFPAAMDRVQAMLERAIGRAQLPLQGIGIGCTGPVDPVSGEIGAVDFLSGWRGCNPVAALAQRFGVRVAMENDADAMALGELAFGAGRASRHLICITVGTGIGGGIVVGGQLYRGVGGAHPEVGHHVIDPHGPECFCGARGCWEVLARGPAMVQRVLDTAPADYAHRDGLTAERLCQLARNGDAVALEEVGRESSHLATGIANLVTLFTPEVIVLSGSVMQSADLFLPAIRARVRRQCGLVPAASVDIRLSSLGADAPLIGAAMVCGHRFQETAAAC
mgnify:CR=1 FL=1